MTIQLTFPEFGLSLESKIPRAIGVLQMWESKALHHDPDNGYWGAFSGGKDSVVIKELARLACVRVRWHYNVTTIDPPELVRFIRDEHPDVVRERQPHTFFWILANERGYPLRHQRWCCQEFKEGQGAGRVKITGVRWAESARRRKQWKQFQQWEPARSHGKVEDVSWMCNPIIDWTDEDVWRFIRQEGLAYCSLYDEGFKRLGCIGCPMSGARGVRRDFVRWPGYERGWRRAFHQLWERRHGQEMTRGKRKGKLWPGLPGIETPDQLFEWWKSGLAAPDDHDGCQLGLW